MDFLLGPWLVQPGLNRLVLGSHTSVVTPKAMEVLVCLARREGAVASKDAIFQEVWPGTHVTDDSLSRCIAELRHAFRDTARRPWVIETIAKRGYRVIPPVVWDSVTPNGFPGSAVVELPRADPAATSGYPAPRRRRLLAAGVAILSFLAVIAAIVGVLRGRRGGSHTIQAIAVLPITDLSGGPGQEYFADGMTEELITELAHLEAWKVVSRTSVMRYKGSGKPIPAIARELAVDAVIEGAVRRSGNRVRITAQLIRADSDTHVWARSFERELSDVLILQREIASEIAAELRVRTAAKAPGGTGRGRRVVPEAYESYLKGRYLLFRGQYSRAASEFEQAAADDPGFALALALLFEAESMENYRRDLPISDRAMRALERAQALDDGLAEVQVGLGDVKFFGEWNWPAGEAAFRRATEIDPGSFDAAVHYAGCLRILRRWDAAEKAFKRALQIDPVSPRINAGWLGFLIDAHRYMEAAQHFEKLTQLEQDRGPAYEQIGLLHQVQGRDSEALAAFLRSDLLQGKSPEQVNALETAGTAGGLRRYWRKRIELLSREAEQKWVPPLDFASLYVRIGEYDQTMRMLEAAYQQHAPRLPWIRATALWDPLRSDPRFQSLLKRMRFPE